MNCRPYPWRPVPFMGMNRSVDGTQFIAIGRGCIFIAPWGYGHAVFERNCVPLGKEPSDPLPYRRKLWLLEQQ
jgi:hypothetical protein